MPSSQRTEPGEQGLEGECGSVRGVQLVDLRHQGRYDVARGCLGGRLADFGSVQFTDVSLDGKPLGDFSLRATTAIFGMTVRGPGGQEEFQSCVRA